MTLPWWAWALATIVTSAGIGWAVAMAWATHDWRTCMCVDCKKRRYHAHKRQGHIASGVKPDGDIIWTAPSSEPDDSPSKHWISTAALEPRMVVILHGIPHRVEQIRTDTKGYLVELVPMGGKNRGRAIIASIQWANGNRKFWEVR